MDEKKTTGEVKYNFNTFKHNDRTVIDLLYSTLNPLTPSSLTPFVDVKARFSLSISEKDNTLNIRFNLKGDGYPSTETFIEDPSGNRILLGAKKEAGAPASKLNDGPEENLFSGDISIKLNKNKSFEQVTDNSTGKIYTPEGWTEHVKSNF